MKFSNVDSVNAFMKEAGLICGADIPAEIYHATQAVSHSMLKTLRQSPAKLRWEMDHPRRTTPAMSLGTAIHCALLEPDLFDRTYSVKREKPKEPERPAELAEVTRRSADGKAKIDAWEATWKPKFDREMATWEGEREAKQMLSQDDMDTVTRVHARTMDDRFFSQFFSSGEKEKSFFVKDEDTGLTLRCRPDNLVQTDSGLFIVDLKSTDCAQKHAFNSDITKYAYYTQAAFYLHVVERAIGERPAGFVIIAVEKGRDCDMQAFYFDREEVELGTRIFKRDLRTFASCVSTNTWPGYEREFVKYRAPEWLIREGEDI